MPQASNPWTYQGTAYTPLYAELVQKHIWGFVYLITNLNNGRLYCGKKNFHTRKPIAGRKGIYESDWKDYYGSSKELTKDIELLGKQQFRREIISLHRTAKQLAYAEDEQLFARDVLRAKKPDGTRLYYNKNIGCIHYLSAFEEPAGPKY